MPAPTATYLPAAAVAVADLRAAIDAMARRSDVTTSGMIAAGHSAGGLATVALTAHAPPGPVAAINFAGGRGSRDDDNVCNPDGLVQAFASFGEDLARADAVGLRDQRFVLRPGSRPRRALLADGFAFWSGGEAKLLSAPPSRRGRSLPLSRGGPAASDAVRRHRSCASAGSRHDILSLPDPLPAARGQLGDAAKGEFARYLASTMPHKAFAVSPNSGYGWRSGRTTTDDAQRDSLAACMKWSPSCTLYAVDDRLAGGAQQTSTDQSARAR